MCHQKNSASDKCFHFFFSSLSLIKSMENGRNAVIVQVKSIKHQCWVLLSSFKFVLLVIIIIFWIVTSLLYFITVLVPKLSQVMLDNADRRCNGGQTYTFNVWLEEEEKEK